MKRYVHKEAACPFYKSEDDQKIYCEGVGEGNSIHVAFGSKNNKKEYRNKYCCKNYNDCIVTKGLLTKYE